MLLFISLLTSAATADAECAWVLWQHSSGAQGRKSNPQDGYATKAECETRGEYCLSKLSEMNNAARLGGVVTLTASGQVTLISLTCFPDTADPRGPEGSGGRESPRRVLRRRTGCGGVVSGQGRVQEGARATERDPACWRLAALFAGMRKLPED